LESLQDFLPTALIVSQVEVRAVDKVASGLGEMFPQTAVVVEKADGQKCGRCWKYREDVGHHQNHDTLCGECVEVVQTVQNVS
jgi:isoleucyl-tRNA synthetase